jgi:hypothetical protein
MKSCISCRRAFQPHEVNHSGRCRRCQSSYDDDETAQRRRDDDTYRHAYNVATGDMLNTGIPGGIDMDMSTPL